MSLWAIIPVKPLNRAKSRLADVLSPQQRYDFAEAMFRQVLRVVTGIPMVAGTIVISRDTKALAMARDMGARTIQESNPSDLNPALTRATEVARLWGVRALLIIPADLPFVNEDDIRRIIQLGIPDSSLVIASDHRRDGTNAMLIRPPGLIEYAYGPNSFERHQLAGRIAGADVRVYHSDELMLDIDLPEDLTTYNQIVRAGGYEMLPVLIPDKTL